jgi:hypothetical protein
MAMSCWIPTRTMAIMVSFGGRGVPIVTRSDGDDMASLVTTSANTVLDLTELTPTPRQYGRDCYSIGE